MNYPGNGKNYLRKRIDHFVTVRKRKNGEIQNVSISIALIIDSEDNVTGAITIARNISKEKSWQMFYDLVYSSPDATIIVSENGKIKACE